MELQRMTDFTIKLCDSNDIENWRKLGILHNYAKFLKTPLTVDMFIPCDKNGNPYDLDAIEDAKNDTMQSAIEWKNLIEIDYPIAENKVLFKGFKLDTIDGIEVVQMGKNIVCARNKNIDKKNFVFNISQVVEDLWRGIRLTQTASKIIQNN